MLCPGCIGTGPVGHACQEVRCEFGEPIQHDGRGDDEAREDQEGERNLAPCHAAGERGTPPALSDVKDEACPDPEQTRWNEDSAVLHGHCHERAAPKTQDDDRKRQETAERRKHGAGPRRQTCAGRTKLHLRPPSRKCEPSRTPHTPSYGSSAANAPYSNVSQYGRPQHTTRSPAFAVSGNTMVCSQAGQETLYAIVAVHFPSASLNLRECPAQFGQD